MHRWAGVILPPQAATLQGWGLQIPHGYEPSFPKGLNNKAAHLPQREPGQGQPPGRVRRPENQSMRHVLFPAVAFPFLSSSLSHYSSHSSRHHITGTVREKAAVALLAHFLLVIREVSLGLSSAILSCIFMMNKQCQDLRVLLWTPHGSR